MTNIGTQKSWPFLTDGRYSVVVIISGLTVFVKCDVIFELSLHNIYVIAFIILKIMKAIFFGWLATYWFLRNLGFLLTTSSMRRATSTLVLSLATFPSISSAITRKVIGAVGKASNTCKKDQIFFDAVKNAKFEVISI